MSSEEIYKEITPFINKCEDSKCTIKTTSLHNNFYSDLGMDSLMVVELIMEIEHKYHFKMDEDDIERLETINDLIEIIQKYGRF